VDAGAAGIHYDKILDLPILYDTIEDSQNNISYLLFSFLFS